jgi:hypothetical protein
VWEEKTCGKKINMREIVAHLSLRSIRNIRGTRGTLE